MMEAYTPLIYGENHHSQIVTEQVCIKPSLSVFRSINTYFIHPYINKIKNKTL